jgi:iron complex outermembrane receptor protein
MARFAWTSATAPQARVGFIGGIGEIMNKYRLAVLFLCSLQALSAHADTYEEARKLLPLSLEELMAMNVSISTSTKQSLSKAPSVVTVITAEDIHATGATNLTDILQGVPGTYIRTNLFGFRPHVTMRGSAANQTLLMVDGAPIKDLMWSSGIYWKGLPTSMIERVEIIRGPGSALFGSDASSGVINVITKTAGKIEQSEAGVRAGSFDSLAGWVQHGTTWNGFDIGFTAEVSRTDGHRPFIAVDGQTSRDRTFGTSASYAPDHAGNGWNNQDLRFSMAKGNWRLQADYMRHGDLEIGLTGAAVLDPLTRASDSRANLALLYHNDVYAEDWGLNAELRYQHLDYTSGDGFLERPPGYTDRNGTYPAGQLNLMRSAERRLSFEASGLYTGLRNHALRLGGGYVNQDLYFVEQFLNYGKGADGNALPAGGPLVNVTDSPYAFAPEKARQTRYLFLQDVWTIARDWEITAGARYDDYSDFGGALSPRLALVWQSADRLTTKLMYGQAFRAPSYLELYAPTSASKPNPDLAPEKTKTWELAFSYLASKDLRLELNLYRSVLTNLIGADSANQYQNTGSITTRGLELEAHWQATRTLRITGSLSQRQPDGDTALLPYIIPEQQAYLRADWAFLPNWHWNIQANWFDKHALPTGDPRAPVGAYAVADTTLRYFHGKEWQLAASLRNLFDADVREISSRSLTHNLPLPGRSVFAEIRYKF